MNQSARLPRGNQEPPRPSRTGTRASATRASAMRAGSLADRLVRLAAAGSTGTLPVTGPSEGAIHFRDGNVTAAQSSRTPGPAAAPTPLAAVPLHGNVRDGKVRARQKPAPARAGLPEDLTALEPTIDAVLDLVVSQSAGDRFKSARRSGGGAAGGLAVDVLLAELARRRHLLEQMSAAVTADTTVIRNPRLTAPRVQVTALQWALVIRAGAGITPRDLAFELGRSVFGTTAEVYRLIALRLLSVADESGQAQDPMALSFIRAVSDEKGDNRMPTRSDAASRPGGAR
jgi:hypothetical protein